MEPKIDTSLEDIFQELESIYTALSAGISTLAVLKKGAESPEMANALGVLGDYLQSSSEGVGQLARIGKRQLTGC